MILIQAIKNLKPNSEWVLNGDSYNDLQWLSADTKPTKKQIDAEIKKIETSIKLNEYKQKRQQEYPSIGDQLDSLFKAGVFPEEMAAQIQTVKDKYPKPEVQ